MLHLLLYLGALAHPVHAQATAFAYSGQLVIGTTRANGTYDFRFTLYTAATGGSAVSTPVIVSGVTVTNGSYAVTLDFGAGSFAGAPSTLYMRIAYRIPGGPWFGDSEKPVQLTVRFAILSADTLSIAGYPVSTAAPASGQALVWNGSAWAPASMSGGGNTYQAGAGLTLTGNVFSIAAAGVVSSMLAGSAVTSAAIAASAVTSSALASGAVTAAALASGAVTSSSLANGAVTSAAIASGAVTATQLGAGAVTASKLASGAVTSSALGSGAVTSSALASGAVTNPAIAASAVTTDKISPTGATSGQALIYNGSAVAWGNPAASSLALPFSGSSNASTAFSITDTGSGVAGYFNTSGSGWGVLGQSVSGYGAIGESSSAAGVHGQSGSGNGVEGACTGGNGDGGSFLAEGSGDGVYGQSYSGDGGYFLGGYDGIYASGSLWAGYFGGDIYVADSATSFFTGSLQINGTTYANTISAGNIYANSISASVKNFKIDHPLDPANKYLVHASIESDEMVNIYRGNALLDERGQAWVQLPGWCQALNKDFSYHLTPVGAPAPNLYIAQEIANNCFQIAGGRPGMKVSWQVTGVRQDAYARAHPLEVEPKKPEQERGKYLHPAELGLPESLGMNAAAPQAFPRR
ncbi:MAG TPA: hypothetical protein VKT32_06405 [Chthonomonadaceae bacterium]|nr:hypothetical protein [Chthonomonadaceae bacterium]